jgi:hypothetical protein
MSIRPDERYPLAWPNGWPRTPAQSRTLSAFKATPDKAYRELLQELERLGAGKVIVSSNLKLRADGAPYANQPRHNDEGIAVYFTRKGKEMALACDKFIRREDNLRAIMKTIDAIRGIERCGSSDMMERAFTGFAQLAPPATAIPWRVALGFLATDTITSNEVERTFREAIKGKHPDQGGDPLVFAELVAARAAARIELCYETDQTGWGK